MTNTHAAPIPAGTPHRSEWRDLVLTPVGDGSTRRRVSDAVTLVVAAGLVAAGIALISKGLSVDVDVARDITTLPDGVQWLISLLWYLGSFGVIAVLAVIALASRRVALARDMALGGIVTWLIGLALAGWLGSTAGRPLPDPPVYASLDFPLVQLAAATAVATAVLPYLTRPARRFFLGLVVLAAVAAALRGEGLPLVVITSLLIGWGVGSGVHLAFGSPTGMPDSGRVEEAANELGFALSEVVPVHPQVPGVALYTGTLDGAPVAVSVYDRDAADMQFLAKAWRFLWYRDTGPRFVWSRVSQVEHEAFVTLSAAQAGARVSSVVGAGIGAEGKAAALITRPAPGRPLAALEAEEVTPAVLADLFEGLARLRTVRIAHGNLSGDVILVADDGTVGFEAFRFGSVSADADRLASDLANALAAAAMVADPEPVVAAAVGAFDAAALSAALTHLQPGVLSHRNRARLHHHKKLLDHLRTEGAKQLGQDPPELVKVTRVKLSTLVMAGGAALGVYLVAKQMAGIDIGDALRSANWGWVIFALVLGVLPNAAQALSVTGSVAVPLPFGATVALELSDNFTGLVGGSVGSDATFIRFFQRRGQPTSVAVTSTLLIGVAAFIAQAVLFGLSYLIVKGDFHMPDRSSSGSGGGGHPIIVTALVALVVGALIILMVPKLRRRVVNTVKPQVQSARANLKELWRHPSKLARLYGGAALAQILFALVLGASLHAYGVSAPIAQLIVINTLAGLLASVAPSPGGMGVMEGGLIAGMTAFGIPTEASIPAVLISRMCTCYLPPIWGYPSLLWLRKHDYV